LWAASPPGAGISRALPLKLLTKIRKTILQLVEENRYIGNRRLVAIDFSSDGKVQMAVKKVKLGITQPFVFN